MKRIFISLLLCVAAALSQVRVVREGVSVTAGAGGVTANYLVVRDGSNPSKYVIPSSAAQCPDGIAAATATAGAAFNLLAVPGVNYSINAGGAITAGHLVGMDSSTWGRVTDLGTGSWYDVDYRTCVIGIAAANATMGNDVTVRFAGPGKTGAAHTHTLGATFDGAGSVLVPGAAAVGFQQSPYTCTVDSYAINVSPSGSATFHIWKTAAGTANPTSADDLSTSGFAISTGTAVSSTSVGDLSSTAITGGDIIGFNLSAVTGSPVWAKIELRCH